MNKKMDLEPYEEILSEWYRINKEVLRVMIGFICCLVILLVSVALFFFGYPFFPATTSFLMICGSFLMAGTFI